MARKPTHSVRSAEPSADGMVVVWHCKCKYMRRIENLGRKVTTRDVDEALEHHRSTASNAIREQQRSRATR